MGTLLSIALRPGKRVAMTEVKEARLCPLDGLLGDYASARHPNRQVTFLSSEAWFRALDEVDVSLTWTRRRANLLINGLELEQSIGMHLVLGECILAVTEETLPCQLMEQVHPGLRAALKSEWRGGVCTRVIKGGMIRTGQTVALVSPSSPEPL